MKTAPLGKRRQPRILLAGSGSSIGFGLAKALGSYDGLGEVILANVSDSYPARAIFPTSVTTPDFYFAKTATVAEFAEAFLQIVHKYGVDIVVPASIFELIPLAELSPRLHAMGCLVLVEDVSTVRTFSDKLETSLALKRLAIPSPDTEEIRTDRGRSVMPGLAMPFLIKPRFGFGSKGVAVIRDGREFKEWDERKNTRHAPFVAQTYLAREDAEYSCTITARADGTVKECMAIKRLKVSGVTTAACYDTGCIAVEAALRALGERLRPRFCLNLQCRLVDTDPCLFEINPRFGAAEPIRAQFGLDTLHNVLSEYAFVRRRRKIPRRFGVVYREYEEVFLPATGGLSP